MGTLTLEGLIYGLLCGFVLPPLASAVLRRPLGRGVLHAVASLGLALAVALALGLAQGQPSTVLGALHFAPGVQAWVSAFLWRDRRGVMLALMAAGTAWLLPALRFIGL